MSELLIYLIILEKGRNRTTEKDNEYFTGIISIYICYQYKYYSNNWRLMCQEKAMRLESVERHKHGIF